ncbi:MAG: YdcF family protein [Patescibacteria group bacterium]|nr:YdcF family protein [Patescibacteria group bacterium]
METSKDTVVVVHGHSNKGYSLSLDLKRRCDKAAELFKHNKSIKGIICTGGLMKREQDGIKNSAAAKEYFINRYQIPAELIWESEAKTTIDDVLNVLKIYKSTKSDKVIAITSSYHAFRTKLIWRLIGKKSVRLVPVESTISIKKVIVEAIGVCVVFCWSIGFTWPELKFRKISRTVSD